MAVATALPAQTTLMTSALGAVGAEPTKGAGNGAERGRRDVDPGIGGSNSTESNGPSSSSSGSTLFNADETRFMNDSLSSAESFDPFTMGTPGFKVPNVLPAHLGGMGAAPGQQSQHAQHGNSDTLPRIPASTIDGPAQASSSKGGYGQDKSWQQQQIDALQAGRTRFLDHQTASGGPQYSSMAAATQNLPDVASIGRSLDAHPQWQQAGRTGGQQGSVPFSQGPPHQQPQGMPYGPGPSMYGMPPQHPMHQRPPFDMAQYPQGMPGYGADPSRGPNPHLANVALQFPSSHDFPHGPGPGSHQRMSTNHSMDSDGTNDTRRGRSPSQRPSWTLPVERSGMAMGPMGGGHGAMQAGPSSRAAPVGKAMSSATAALAGTMEPDAPYVFEPAPRPGPPTVDLDKAAQAGFVPDDLKDSYFAEGLQRLQPHLALLREEQMRRKEMGFSANIRKSNKQMAAREKGEDADGANDSDEEEDGDGKDKKKQPHVLLTEAEKKANHIASEQKRRANIRKGYEMLSEMVPALRDSAEQDGVDGDADGADADDDDDDSSDGKPSKKRGADRGTGADNKGAPRSEATILMHAVEHIRAQLQEHKDLLKRRDEARSRLAQNHGIDVRVPAPAPRAAPAATGATTKKKGGAVADTSKRKGM